MTSLPPTASRRGVPATLWIVTAVVTIAMLVVVGVLAWAIALGVADAQPAAPPPRPAAPAPPSDAATSSPPSTPPSAGDDDLAAVLSTLPIADDEAVGQYFREQFGQAWYDQDRNGCDTRNDILRRDLSDVVTKEGTRDCKVLTGVLDDPYTGERVDFVAGADTSALVQIDHVIPLSWAWRHGAERWTFEQRQEFANDPSNLRATAGAINQSKSDSGPSEWMPPQEASLCDYAETWIETLATWKLSLSGADRDALAGALTTCPGE
ncbi:HNH endonuclease family protein [Microbacterium sp.]|uniref:HNH endonuclease family protein n=1 Tax=Microbacterium sp. TaxID=51671 RepID=UPI0039E6D9D2